MKSNLEISIHIYTTQYIHTNTYIWNHTHKVIQTSHKRALQEWNETTRLISSRWYFGIRHTFSNFWKEIPISNSLFFYSHKLSHPYFKAVYPHLRFQTFLTRGSMYLVLGKWVLPLLNTDENDGTVQLSSWTQGFTNVFRAMYKA